MHLLLSFLRFSAIHYGLVATVCVAAFALGRRILRRFVFANGFEEAALASALGFGILAQTIFVLGLVGLIYPATMWLVIAASAALGWRDLGSALSRSATAVRRSTWKQRLVAIVVVAAIVVLAVLPLYPPYLWDALSYHLPSARAYAESHRIHPTPYLRFCVFAQLNEMLFTMMFELSDAVSAQATEFLLFLLTGCAVAGAAGRVNRRAIAPAGLAWLGMPQAVLLGSQAYIDIGLALFATAFLIAAWVWTIEGRREWLLLAAAFGGFAASTKYTALFVIGCFGLLLCVRAFRTREPQLVAAFGAVVALIALPWYAYIYYHTHNPVFPFASGIFGTGCWNAGDTAHVNAEFAHLGNGHTLKSFALLPVDLAFERGDFKREAPLSILYLGLPLWIAFGLTSRKTRFLGAILLAYVVFWFSAAQVPRYLLPILPTICVLAGCAVAWILRPVATPAAIALVSAIMAVPSLRFARDRILLLRTPPVNETQRSAFYQNNPTYGCYEWLNRQYGHNYTVYAFDQPYMVYFADGTRIGDVVGPGRYKDFIGADGLALKKALDVFHAGFALFATDPHTALRPIPSDSGFRSYFRPVATCTGAALFQISPTPFHEQLSNEILVNGGFEDGDRNWTVAPQLRVDRSGTSSHAGTTAVRVEPSSIQLSQPVKAVPHQSYAISFFARADTPGARSRFVISWFDATGRDLRDDVHLDDAQAVWRQQKFVFVAPPDAFSATVYPESVDGRLWYDDVSMRELSYVPGAAPEPAKSANAIFGVYRPNGRHLFIRHQFSEGFADQVLTSAVDGIPVAGDWQGDGNLAPAIYAPDTGRFYVLGPKPKTMSAASRGVPVAGDWNGTGHTSAGTFDPGTATFDLRTDTSHVTFAFGAPGDLPISGDWDGDGVWTVGVYRPSTATFYLRNSNTAGPPDIVIPYGAGTEQPVAGDWNNDGRATPGLYDSRHGVFRLRNDDGSEVIIHYGLAGDRPFSATMR